MTPLLAPFHCSRAAFLFSWIVRALNPCRWYREFRIMHKSRRNEQMMNERRIMMSLMTMVFALSLVSAYGTGSVNPTSSSVAEVIRGEGLEKKQLSTGTCGDDCHFTLDLDTLALTITGSGKMDDYYYPGSNRSPWANSSIQSVKINGISSIGSNAFISCSSLTNVSISDSVEFIRAAAFQYCSSLVTLSIPPSIREIESNAFCDCGSLTTINIPDSVKTINSFTFYNCESLTNITLPESLTDIRNFAFSHSAISEIRIPDSVQFIGEEAFSSCKSLISIIIPESVTSIGKNAFEGCDSLQFKVDGNAKYLGSETNPHYALISAIDKTIASCDINETTRVIAAGAFEGCDSLISVTIPESVSFIGYRAFYGCSSLTSISIPESVTTIEDYTFSGCDSLTNITIPESVKTIGYGAFYFCKSLKTVIILGNVSSMGSHAFYFCTSLTTLYYLGTQNISGSRVLEGCSNLTVVNVPPEYEGTFCGMETRSDTFPDIFNQCYEGIIVDDVIVPQRRTNATKWENQTNNCATYQCDNKSGPAVRYNCNGASGASGSKMICVEGECVSEDTIREPYFVEIEVEPGMDMEDLEELRLIVVKECGMDFSDVKIGWESDGHDIIRVLMYFDDEEMAKKAKDAVSQCL